MFRTRGFLLCGLVALAAAFSARAQTDIEISLVAVTTAMGSETVTTLPTPITAVCDGDTCYIEMWATDSGTINTGVSSA